VKTQGSLPTEDAALVLLFSLVASGQIKFAPDRRVAQDRRGAQQAYGGGGMMMTRAALAVALAVGILALPLASEAQQATKVWRIGYLTVPSRETAHSVADTFQLALRDLGWIEGQNLVLDYRFADSNVDRLPDLAAELVRLTSLLREPIRR
jgi:hypothetical protein